LIDADQGITPATAAAAAAAATAAAAAAADDDDDLSDSCRHGPEQRPSCHLPRRR
jgi:hypothetical protein